MQKQILFAFLSSFLLAQDLPHMELSEHEPPQNFIIFEDDPDLSTDIQAKEAVATENAEPSSDLISSLKNILQKSPSSETAATENVESSDYLISSLKGVLFVPDRSYVAKSGVVVEGFQAMDMDFPGGQHKINAKLFRFIGQPLNKEGLLELKREVILYYREQGYHLVSVEIPEQSLAQCTVQLVVTESTLGKISVYNNKYFSTEQIKKCLREKIGDPICLNTLFNDVAWINANPFRRADVVLAAGEKPKTTDIELYVKDRFPLQVYVGNDNTGIPSTGQNRIFAGFHYGNLFGIGHLFSYQFTMSDNYHKFWAHTGFYNAPLPWRHNLILFGGYSEIHPELNGFSSKGRNAQASIRYQIPINAMYNGFIQEAAGGFDFKKINSNLFFTAISVVPVVTQAVNITQFYGSYSLGKEWDDNKFNMKIEGLWSPGEMVGDQSNQDFSDLQPGAVNHYFYARASFANTWFLKHNFSIISQLRGQVSTQNLIASEQFGLGGYNTVRGYAEREYSYDDAVCVNLEIYSPPFRVFRNLKSHLDEMKLLAFFDYGTGRDVHKEFEPQWQQLISAGPGVRYKIADYLSARFDWGIRLHTVKFTGLGSRIHFGAIASY